LSNPTRTQEKTNMGYTHYYYTPKEFDEKIWKLFIRDVKKLAKALPDTVKIAGGCGTGEPEYSKDVIVFNGAGENSFETFCIDRKANVEGFVQEDPKGRIFNCCKTAQRPYDLFVMLTLISLKRWFGKEVMICSDGDKPDWKQALDLYKEVARCEIPWFILMHEDKDEETTC
jgi:hypothetical protein